MPQHDAGWQPAASASPHDLAAALAAAERRALSAESRYDALVRALAERTWTANAAGQLTQDISVGRAFTGERQGDLSDPNWMDALHPDDRAAVLTAWEHSIAAETPFSAVGRVQREDGVYRMMQLRGAPVRDAAGVVREWVGISWDITERGQAHEDAMARAAQLEATIEVMVDPVVISDQEGHLLHANAAFRALLGTGLDPDYERRPLAERMRLIAIRTPEGDPLPADEWPLARVLRGETISDERAHDFMVSALDGRDVLLSPTGAPVRDPSGAITGGVAIYRDVTERRRLERRTRDALAALLAMAEALVKAPEPVAENEPAPGSILSEPSIPPEASDAARRLAELTVDVLSCRYVSILSLTPALSAAPAAPQMEPQMESLRLRGVAVAGLTSEQTREWWARYASGVSVSLLADAEQVARLAAGEEFLADVRTPAYSGAAYGVRTNLWVPLRIGEQLVGVLAADYGVPRQPDEADRTLASACGKLVALVVERERLLRERTEAQATALALREANRRLDEFLSIASHELRTPLTTIKANVQLAQRRARSTAEEAAQRQLSNARAVEGLAAVLARTSAAVERQNRLVNDLLDVSRIHAGRLEMRLEPLNLVAAVEDAVEEQRLAHPNRMITFAAPEHPVTIVADGERIRQVIANYLTNALKYSSAQQPVDVQLQDAGDVVRVTVRDRGVGIPADEQDHVWERFHRARGVGHLSGSGVGLGLGLFISREIVERHGGQVGVVSAPGAGSEFWFTLPGH
jgi:PAS domain S-box-containing protein